MRRRDWKPIATLEDKTPRTHPERDDGLERGNLRFSHKSVMSPTLSKPRWNKMNKKRVADFAKMTCAPILLLGGGCSMDSPSIQIPIEIRATTFTSPALDVSPDGDQVLLTVLGDVYLVDIATGASERVNKTRADSWYLQARFGATRSEVIVSRLTKGEFTTVRLDTKSNVEKSIGEAIDIPTRPVLLPDGSTVLSRGLQNAYAVDKQADVQCLSDAHDPDTDWVNGIVYYTEFNNAELNGESGIYSCELSTGLAKSVVDGPGGEFFPKTSRGGEILAYQKFEGEALSLYVQRLSGGSSIKIADLSPVARFGRRIVKESISAPSYGFTADAKRLFYVGSDGLLVEHEVNSGRERRIPISLGLTLRPGTQPERQVAPLVHNRIGINDFAIISDDQAIYQALGDLWRYDRTQTKVENISSSSEFEFMPDWNPSRGLLAYISKGGEREEAELRLRNVANNVDDILVRKHILANPTWIDQNTLAYLSSNDDFNFSNFSHSMSLDLIDYETRETRTVFSLPTVGVVRTKVYPSLGVFQSAGKRFLYVLRRNSRNIEDVSLLLMSFDELPARYEIKVVGAKVEDLVISPNGQNVLVKTPYSLTQHHVGSWPEVLSKTEWNLDFAEAKHLALGHARAARWNSDTTATWLEGNSRYIYSVAAQDKRVSETIQIPVVSANNSENFALINAKIITNAEPNIIEDGYIHVKNGRILSVGKANELNSDLIEKIIDVSGYTIVPGFVDAHSHYHQVEQREVFSSEKSDYKLSLCFGVTTVFDPAAADRDAFQWKQLIDTGRAVGPRVYSTGHVIHGDPASEVHKKISSEAIAHSIVESRRVVGASAIKSYLQPKQRARTWLAGAAQTERIPITKEGGRSYDEDILDLFSGYTSIEHGTFHGSWNEDWILALGAAKAHITPVFLTELPRIARETNSTPFECPEIIARIGYERHIANCKKYTGLIPLARERLVDRTTELGSLVSAGGEVSVGSHGIVPGLGVHWDLWILEAGMPDKESALKASSLWGARKIGIDHMVGSIEPGKAADLLILADDPLDDITNTFHVNSVFKGGRKIDRVKLCGVSTRD